jgi:hypothetical protein
MANRFTVAILGDIHYAGPMEQKTGDNYDFALIRNPLIRCPLQTLRNFAWLKNPTRQNRQLDRFFADVGEPDYVVANGDLGCDCSSLGLADDATRESARDCLNQLQARFGKRLHLTIGDHELGKLSLLGERGGLRLESWRRAIEELGIKPGWKVEVGNYALIGITSTLVALPAYERDVLPMEGDGWQQLRATHLEEIRAIFDSLESHQRMLLFCHDPTALPYLWRESSVRRKLDQIEQTMIGHLHSKLIFWKSRLLAGMPVIRFLGGNVQRMTTALNEARKWREFRARLCPALAGIELLNDGGFLTAELDPAARAPIQFRLHPLPR